MVTIMKSQLKSTHIPRATIHRLATYVQVLEFMLRDEVEIISSKPLAQACGVNSSQVRKDLAYFGEFGIRGVGYNVKKLIDAIKVSLGVNREWGMALIGAGNLGRALLNNQTFIDRGFHIKAIFDCNPLKVGEKLHGIEVRCIEDLKKQTEQLSLEIGIITTPPERAQRACQHLLDAGINSILNFAPARIKVPSYAHVEYVDFFHQLYGLAFKKTLYLLSEK